jgi:hypothetical protein
MKKILLTLFLIFISTSFTIGQNNFNRSIIVTTKKQKKVLRSFSSGKRHKRYIPFKRRSSVGHPAVNVNTKRILKRRYREQVTTKN